MGWVITLKADRPIDPADVAAALKTGGGLDVGWGWKAFGVDVDKPQGDELRISGAWYSVRAGKPAAQFIAGFLDARGYQITIGGMDG